MKKMYLKGFTLFCSLALTLACTFKIQAQTVTTFSHTGVMQTFTVPSCVNSITVMARGAQGGDAAYPGANGGAVTGVLAVTPGQVLNIFVGGQGSVTAGGFNGGGNAGTGSNNGGGGGGGSDVRTGGIALTDRKIVAGGGGGSGGNTGWVVTGGTGGGGTSCSSPVGVGGGAGNGCASGGVGACSGGAATTYGTGGAGGGLTSGGGISGTTAGQQGGAGVLGVGGVGGGQSGGGIYGGGGGGGGFYGGSGGSSGNGGCHGGGGGGSSFADGTVISNITFTAGNGAGHGLVTLTYAMNGTGVTIASTPSILCSGSPATLTAGGVVTYTWLPVGTFTGANTTTIVESPVANTTYTVKGTNTQGCISTAIYTLQVDPAVPSLSVANTASASGGICPTKTVMLTASGARSYTWTASSGNVTNGVAFAPATSGVYTVTGGNACGTSTSAVSLSVHPLPTINTVVSSPSVCSTATVMFTAVGNATSYVWTHGIQNGVPIILLNNTTATVLATSAQGCTAQAVSFVSVVTTPQAQAVSNPTLICVGSSAVLSAPGATSYTWTTPGGTLSSSQITVSPVVTTTYSVTKSNANCVDVQTVQVIVNNLPSVQAFAAPPIICSGKSSVLQGGGASTFTWTAPGFTTTGASPTVSPINSTTYVVTASDGTCINTATTQVLTNPNPVINIAPSATAICRGESVNLSATGALSYTWTTSSGTLTSYPNGTAVTNSFQDTPDQITLYTVTGENTYTCYTNATQVIIVHPNPTLNVQTSKPVVCTGGLSNLTVTGADTYSWDANAGNSTASITPVNPAVTTIYTVTGYYAFTKCNSQKTIEVAVFLPTFAVNSPTSSCLGGTINLIASGAKSYTWATNPPQQISSIQVAPKTPTFYVVTATSVTNNIVSCTSTQTVDVTIYDNPTITAVTSKTLVCKGEQAQLTGGGGSTYSWTPSNQMGSTVNVSPTGNQVTYTVLGTDQNGCTGTHTVLVKVSTCFGLEELNANKLGLNVYPNPNNGQFTISSEKDLSIDVLNSIGQHINTFTIRAGEDQKINLGHLPAGVYFLTGAHDGEGFAQKMILKD